MHISFSLLLALSASANALRPRNYDTHDYYAVHLDPIVPPEDIATRFGLELEGQLGELRHHYLLRAPRHDQNIVQEAVEEHRKRKRRRDLGYQDRLLDGILLHQKQKLKPPMVKRGALAPLPHAQRQGLSQDVDSDAGEPATVPVDPATAEGEEIAKALNITDPSFKNQWHLYNAVQPGHDLNVTGVWMQGITGKNATVCIVDDGLDMDSDDLRDNYFAEGSYDFNDNVPEPKPRLSDDRHGTRCAGEVSAVKNDVCGVGVAWDSKIAGIRILSRAITDADEAIAMNYAFQKTQIYSCSWGPPDDGQEMGQPGILIKRAMVTAVQKGRGGLGTIYVFAVGNGAAQDDNCNFDGYTNSIYSITIGAIDRKGLHPYYSEKCSAQLAVAYSSGSGSGIYTTDVGTNNCYGQHGGTSAAGPLAAGIYALVLEVRPDLTWRDMQWLTVLTAVKPDDNDDSDWQETTIGRHYSHQFGYGKLDAWAMVEAAKNFTSRNPQAWFNSPWQHVRTRIPQGDLGLSSVFIVNVTGLNAANLGVVEQATVTMNIEHTRRGDLSVDLRSPRGIVSHLSTPRRNDNAQAGYSDWTFMSVAHWGESGEGPWTLIVKDTVENEHTGVFVDWKLNLFGSCINPSIQDLLPLPNEHDDDNHDRENGTVSTTIVSMPSSTSAPLVNPTDHIDRPVNVKPSVTSQVAVTETASTAPFENPDLATSSVSSAATSATSSPTSATETPYPDTFLPSPFPTFGVSKRTQIWIYGAAGLILIFCSSIATYFYLARRKRQKMLARENYEFEMLEDEDDNHRGANGVNGGKKGKRRAGELYDAFQPGDSDEEVFLNDDEAYRDEASESTEKHRP